MRPIHDIPGGIHPAENKTQSLGGAIRWAGIPEQLVLPLSQHIGAPAVPVVAAGDAVLKGQLLARANGFVSAPVHAPTSGTVIALEERPLPHPSSMQGPCIVLATDGEDRWCEHRGCEDYLSLDKPTLLQLIRDAGISGMGGAGFPTGVKLATDKPIASLLINGTECEPYITADDALMRERAAEIIAGVRILSHLVAPGETVIGIEDNKPRAIALMRQAAEGTGIEIASFPTKYPSGGEKQLIQILTGKEVPSGGLPADIGVVLQNVGTAYAVQRAVVHGEPLISRITTVTGDAVKERGNFETLLGTPVHYLLDLCGIDQTSASRLILGGPMMGFALENADAPIVKTTNCILLPTPQELPPPKHAQACIRCGMCAEACPASLLPQQLYWFAQGKEYDKLEAHHLFDCIECGCCSYVCPSNIPLVQYYRASKAAINLLRRDSVKSEQARERFEARQQRIEREQAEKAARRKARTAKNKVTGGESKDKGAAIEAAVARAAAKKQPGPVEAAPSSAPTTEDPQATVTRLEQRLAKAQLKYQQVLDQGGEHADAFAASVAKLQTSLDEARRRLVPPGSRPAEAAIEPASRSGGAGSDEGPAQQLARLEQRLAKARSRLERARAEGAEQQEALASAVAALEDKCAQARRAGAGEPAAEKSAPTAPDPALEAIERARSARRAPPATPEEKLAKLRQRLDKARERLQQARDAGDDTLPALEAAVLRVEGLLRQAQAESTDALATTAAPSAPSELSIQTLERRLETAQAGLAQATTDNSSQREACKQTVDRLQRALDAARQGETG